MEKLASLQQASGRLHDEVWEGVLLRCLVCHFLSLLLSHLDQAVK